MNRLFMGPRFLHRSERFVTLNSKIKKGYGQLPGCDVLVELVEPVAAFPELEEQLD